MPLDRNFIEEALASLEENVLFLRQLGRRSPDEFASDRAACYAAAYALMIAIEAISGIAAHLIAALSLPTPRGMAHSFEVLGQNGILTSSELVTNLGQMSRFRNLVVHRYWQVDFRIVHRIITENLADFSEFAAQTIQYLENVEE